MKLHYLGLGLVVAAGACGNPQRTSTASGHGTDTAPAPAPVAAAVAASPAASAGTAANVVRPPLSPQDKQMYRNVAKQSLGYLIRNWHSSTGLVNATPDWANTTMWDVGAQLLGFHAAKELGLITEADYQARTRRTLATLETMPLYHGAAFNKLYTTDKATISREGRPGWSATDLGRFLIAIKILSQREPAYAAQLERIARRNDFRQIVKNGYLQGQLIGSDGKPWTFQEGRIGYEQYVANGFAQWGADVGNALNVHQNAQPVAVMNVPLLADKRYQDRLLSEPFVLYGLELGMPSDIAQLASNVLKAQEARYKSAGQVTVASEDAVSVPPDYFYYYCGYCGGKPFVVETAAAAKDVARPRWVSTKAAFGWNAVMPNDYTRAAVDYVAPALDSNRGWASGVMEGSRESTKTYDINTASVLLEVALFELRGAKPLIQDAALVP
jgi:hypothetical protein